jgi:hypothetical protein
VQTPFENEIAVASVCAQKNIKSKVVKITGLGNCFKNY